MLSVLILHCRDMTTNHWYMPLLWYSHGLKCTYTYSKEHVYHGISNIWLNVPSPLVAVFDIYLQASGIVNPSSWQNRWSSTEFVGFLTLACFISTIHVFSMRFRSGLWEDHNYNPSLIDPFLYNFWCVFGIIVLLEHPTELKTQSSTDDFRFTWRI